MRRQSGRCRTNDYIVDADITPGLRDDDSVGSATDFNKAYYDQLTAGRENYWRYMPAPRMRIAHIIARIGDERRSVSSVCDFGCGNGGLLRAIAASHPDAILHGIDLSSDQIEQNRRAMPGARWAQADLTSSAFDYPFAGRCDVAVSSEVVEHLDEPLRYLRNIHGCLTDGGVLVLTTQSGPVHATELHVGHVRHWEAGEMDGLLRDAGFRQTRTYNCGYPFHDLSKWAANLRPQQVIRQFGQDDWGAVERAAAAILRSLFHFNSSVRGYQLIAVAHR